MDRRKRTWMAASGCGLVLMLATTGCKSTQNKVPPGRAYSSDGKQEPAIGFSSGPHPANNAGNDMCPSAAMAPATMSVGTAGTGRPIWSSSTLRTTINKP